MDDTIRSRCLVETDPVDATPERLQDWIDACEHLVAKIGQASPAPEFEWMRALLESELERKRRMLAALAGGRRRHFRSRSRRRPRFARLTCAQDEAYGLE